VGEGRVDEDRPEGREQDERAEPLALGVRAGDEGRRDRREHHLERREQDERDRAARDGLEADAHEADEVEAADETEPGDVRPEREGEADEDPDDAHDRQAEEAVHDRRQDVLASHEAAVEQGEAGQHHHDHRGGDDEPGGVAAVDRAGLGGCGRPGRRERGGAQGCRHCGPASSSSHRPLVLRCHVAGLELPVAHAGTCSLEARAVFGRGRRRARGANGAVRSRRG
jgi:hypothetical protein